MDRMKGVEGVSKNTNGRRVFGPPQGRNTRDEDLVLFRELHKREKDCIASLLLPVSDEFEPTGGTNYAAALFRMPSNKKSAQGLESLSGAEKNDYDWLRTPPATPLFPSLEMETMASAPELAVHRELPIMQPLSRYSSSSQQRPKIGQEVNPKPKTPSTNKPKPSPTAALIISPTSKPNTLPWSNHPDPFLTSNLSKSGPKPKPESTLSSRPKSRGSVSPSVRRMINDVSDQTPANLKTDKRSLSSTRGRAASGRAVDVPPSVKAAADPRPSSTARSRAGVSGRKTNETMPLRAGDSRRQSCSPSVSRGRRPAEVAKERRREDGGGVGTTTHSSFFGSKMVDRLMSARKSGSGGAAEKTADRVAAGGGGGVAKVVVRKSSLDMAVKLTAETKVGQRRRSINTTSTEHAGGCS